MEESALFFMISLMKILAFPNDKIIRKEKTNQYTQDLRDQMQEQSNQLHQIIDIFIGQSLRKL